MGAESISLRIQVSNVMIWKANHYGIDPEFQNAVYGIRTIRSNQNTVSMGARVSF
jgi:hypothetical protein